MTLDDIQARLDEIRKLQDDDEVAHVKEDRLHRDVLDAIALGDLAGVTAAQAAHLALTSERIGFSRWYS